MTYGEELYGGRLEEAEIPVKDGASAEKGNYGAGGEKGTVRDDILAPFSFR